MRYSVCTLKKRYFDFKVHPTLGMVIMLAYNTPNADEHEKNL